MARYTPHISALRAPLAPVRWLSLLCWLTGLVLSFTANADAQPARGPVFVGEIRGIINPVMAGYIDRVIDEAELANATAVIFRMDTPGGLVDTTREINQRILAAGVPVVIYVAPDGAHAGSAGVFITYAAHLAAMSPTTNIGSATPVALGEGGEQQMSEEMQAKILNDAVAQIRALAEQRGRDIEFAEQAVREGANLQASEAHSRGVVNYLASDLNDLLRQMDGATVQLATGQEITLQTAGVETRPAEMSAVERFLLTITNPTIAYILLSIGSLGLVLELYNPGSIFPGVIGAISLLLAFYALGTLPLNFAALGLMLFGVALLALEPFVSSSGVLAIGGTIAFLIGSLLLINVPESAPFLEISLIAIIGVTLTLLASSLLVLGAVWRAQRRKSVTGREGLRGATGVARTAIDTGQEGNVFVQSELWRAVNEGPPIARGDHVVVTRVDGLLLYVQAVPASTPPMTPTHSRPARA